MRTEMTLEILGDQDDARNILTALAKSGIVVHQARIQGNPVDVTPLVALAAEAAPDDALDALLEDVPEPVAPAGPLAEIDFASDEAAEQAADLGLVAADFDDIEASGVHGYTVADVRDAHSAAVAPGGRLDSDTNEAPAEPVGA